MIRLALCASLALALPAGANPRPALKLNLALKLPPGVAFMKNSTAVHPKDANLTITQQYLAAKPEITMLRVAGYPDPGDKPEAGAPKAAARALAVAKALVAKGVDCKRLIAVGFDKPHGAHGIVTFVNAALKGKPIGGAPVAGGGKVAGDVCSGATASTDSSTNQGDAQQSASAASSASQSSSTSQAAPASAGHFKSGSPSEVCGAANLSAIRQKILAELDETIPSVQGMNKSSGRNLFDGVHQMTQAEYAAAQAAHRPIVTTCGLLPGVTLKHVGLKGPLTAGGTEGLRLCAQGLGKPIFVEDDGTRLPKPGDLYWLRYAASPKLDSVSHVGIICSTDGDTWKTLDAGQGSATQQAAQIVNRKMQKVDGTHHFLAGPGYVGDPAQLRRLGGWIDADELFAAQDRAAAVKLVVKGNSATCK
jgi:OOP family OmpA-OmpF porin